MKRVCARVVDPERAFGHFSHSIGLHPIDAHRGGAYDELAAAYFIEMTDKALE
jgi:hypothetical protein